MNWLLRYLSVPDLRRAPGRYALSVVGIAIGVATIVATLGVADSVVHSFERSMATAMGSATLRVGSHGAGVDLEIADELRAQDGVRGAAGIIHRSVVVTGDEDVRLTLIGVDMVGDAAKFSQALRESVSIADEVEFLGAPDSVVVSGSWAADEMLALADTLTVMAVDGPRELVVRGVTRGAALEAAFGGRFLLMDLPAAQLLLGNGSAVDYIDVWLDEDAAVDVVRTRLATVLEGRATILDSGELARRAASLIFAVRVFLMMAGFVAVVVGFFILYNTVSTVLRQRRDSIQLLHALGTSRRSILSWLLVESVLIATLGFAVGVALGRAFASISIEGFIATSGAFLDQPTARLDVQWVTFFIAAVSALSVAALATIIGWKRILPTPEQQVRAAMASADAQGGPNRWVYRSAIGCFAAVAALVVLAPRTLPYYPLVFYLLTTLGIVLFGFGVLSPVIAEWVGRRGFEWAVRRPGFPAVHAFANVGRDPGGLVIAASAIVMAIASTLAVFSLTTSLERTALAWIDQHFTSDAIVTVKGQFLQTFTATSISPDVLAQIRDLDDVRIAQGIRNVEIEYEGEPVLLRAIDMVPAAMELNEVEWSSTEDAFGRGRGVFVSENLAHWRDISVGSTISLDAPAGAREFTVLGTFADYLNSAPGVIVIARDTYTRVWGDSRINRVRVWGRPGAVALGDGMSEVVERYHLEVTPVSVARASFAEFIRGAFSSVYAMVGIALIVSFAGVLNFLLIAVADRIDEISVLRANGVSAYQIMLSTMGEAGIVGAVAAVLGTVAGFAASVIIITVGVPMVTGWFFDFHFPLLPPLQVFVGAMVFAFAAGLIPGVQAVRLSAASRRAG